MSYEKQTWNNKTWGKGQKKLEEQLNHMEDGIVDASQSGGTIVEGNPTGIPGDAPELEAIKIGENYYKAPVGGGILVEANPTSLPQDAPELEAIKIGDNYFKIPEGGGGSGAYDTMLESAATSGGIGWTEVSEELEETPLEFDGNIAGKTIITARPEDMPMEIDIAVKVSDATPTLEQFNNQEVVLGSSTGAELPVLDNFDLTNSKWQTYKVYSDTLRQYIVPQEIIIDNVSAEYKATVEVYNHIGEVEIQSIQRDEYGDIWEEVPITEDATIVQDPENPNKYTIYNGDEEETRLHRGDKVVLNYTLNTEGLTLDAAYALNSDFTNFILLPFPLILITYHNNVNIVLQVLDMDVVGVAPTKGIYLFYFDSSQMGGDGEIYIARTAAMLPSVTKHSIDAAYVMNLGYLTTAPTQANTNGLIPVILEEEPATRYDGYIYIITEDE